jgi:acetylornithine deacetylase/succinyl-diaminopimelate desuccinylase-like protein
MGPGNSQLSHTANEWIDLEEVRAGARLYSDVAREYLK